MKVEIENDVMLESLQPKDDHEERKSRGRIAFKRQAISSISLLLSSSIINLMLPYLFVKSELFRVSVMA